MNTLIKNTINIYPHQKTAIDFIQRKRYAMIGDEMGVGKTLSAIGGIQAEDTVFIICPASLRTTWKKEIVNFTTIDEDHIELVDKNTIFLPYGIYIMSYAGLSNMDSPPTDDVLPDYVILDESHYVKNPLSKRSQRCLDLVIQGKPDRVALLTGTPITKSPLDFYLPLQILSKCPHGTNGLPLKFENHFQFGSQFTNMRWKRIGSRKVREFSGCRNLDGLRDILKNKYLRRRVSDVLKDLPPMIEKTTHITDNSARAERYIQSAWLDKDKKEVEDHVMAKKCFAAQLKVPSTCKYIEDMKENGVGKILIFSDHLDPIKDLARVLGAKWKVDTFTGANSEEERAASVEAFQSGDTEILICSIRAAGVGLTLTAASHVVFNDISWSPDHLEQAKKRIHRIGQDNTCFSHIVLSGPMDESIYRVVCAKQKVIDKVLH